jgi:hypothetical protein
LDPLLTIATPWSVVTHVTPLRRVIMLTQQCLGALESDVVFCCFCFLALRYMNVFDIVVAQHTNHPCVAASISQMELSVECLHFLCLKQDLPRVKPVDLSGTVKVNRTSTKTQYRPMWWPRIDFLTLSTHSMLPKRLNLVKTVAVDHFQVPQGPHGTQNSPQPRCHDNCPQIQ